MSNTKHTTPLEAYRVGYGDAIMQAQITLLAAVQVVNEMSHLTKNEAILLLMEHIDNQLTKHKNENATN